MVVPGGVSGRMGRRQLAASDAHEVDWKKGAAKGRIGGKGAPPAPPAPPPEEEVGGRLEVAPDITIKPS